MARVMDGMQAGGGRSPRARAKGATRKEKQVQRPTRNLSAWFNRIIILAGAGVVIAAGLQAFITLRSLPVTQISVTGKLEHTRKQEVQQMIQPAL